MARFKEAAERFHQLDHGDVWAGIDELVKYIGRVGPAPSIGECVELRLAYLPAWLAKENVVIDVRVKRRIEIDQIDARVGELFPIRKPFKIVAEIQPIHLEKTQNNSRFVPPSPHGYGAAGDVDRSNKCRVGYFLTAVESDGAAAWDETSVWE